jgi:2-dehydropantoate 2-reductase
MKILVYGAGVIGSVYAAWLHEANSNITLLARGKRYKTLEQVGLITRDALTGKQTTYNVPLVQQLSPNDFYDLIIVTVRYDQIGTVLPVLKNNTVSPLILFMLNNPDDMEQLTAQLPKKDIILGFPGVGGTYQDNFIEFILIKQQKTTIGEVNGQISARTQKIKTIFEMAGFKTEISTNMQEWLKIHAVFVSCVAAAIIKEN